MKITFVLPVADMGGGVKVVTIYAKALEARGHKVVIVSVPRPTIAFRHKLRSLIRDQHWPQEDKAPSSHLDGTGLHHHVLDSCRPVMDADVPDADVVIATWWETAEWVARLSPRKGVKVYFIQHHEVFPYLPVARCDATYRLPLHKIVIARWLADVMRERYDDGCVDVVSNSV